MDSTRGEILSSSAFEHLRVVTFANVRFIHMMVNFIAHMHHSIHSHFPFEVRTLDDVTFMVCMRSLPLALGGRCFREPCCNESQPFRGFPSMHFSDGEISIGMRLVEQVLMYKVEFLVNEFARGTPDPIVILDTTALVSSAACFKAWASHPEDIVTTIEYPPGCPAGAGSRMGLVLNTGATLYRPAARRFLEKVLDKRAQKWEHKTNYRFHCFEQELVNQQLVLDGFTWKTFYVDGFTTPSDEGSNVHNLSLHFLPWRVWPRDFRPVLKWTNYTDRRKPGEPHANYVNVIGQPVTDKGLTRREGGCLFHPWIFSKYDNASQSSYADVYLRAGLWHLR